MKIGGDSMKKKEAHKQIRVVHIMADGSVRDSVEGYPVPVNDITRPAYNILATMALQAREKEAEQKTVGQKESAI
jgi:hypothetical protein